MKKRRILPAVIAVFSAAAMIYAGIFWPVAFLLGMMVYGVMLFVFYDRNDVLKERMVSNVFGTTEFKIRSLINLGRKKVFEIKKINAQIKDMPVKKRVESITDLCENIFTELRENPASVKKLRKFFNYYLDSVLLIVKKYESISNFRLEIENRKAVLDKASESLEMIFGAFTTLLKSLKESDAEDLDLEIQVLSNALKTDFLKQGEKS